MERLKIGMPKTIGELRGMIEFYPDKTEFSFRNQPRQTLFELTYQATFIIYFQLESKHTMKKISLIELYKFLKYNKILTFRYIFTQIKSRYYCKKYHKQWIPNPINTGSGKYNYQQYECNTCGCVHYEFELNKSK